MTNVTMTDPLAGLFDDGEPTPRWWQRRITIVAVAITVVAVLVVSFAMGAFGASGDSYRTVVVAERAVDAELTGVATIEPTSQATVGFPNRGTVASVSVKVGDEVAAGDVLGRLDTTALEQQLHDAQQTLADASLTLAKGLAGTKSTTAGSGTTARKISTLSSTGSPIVLTAATSTDPELAAAQQAVLDGQSKVDAAMTTASTALDNAIAVCAPSSTDPSADASDSAPDASDPAPDTCTTALQAVLDAQKAVQTAQNQLAAASIAYDELLGATGGDAVDPVRRHAVVRAQHRRNRVGARRRRGWLGGRRAEHAECDRCTGRCEHRSVGGGPRRVSEGRRRRAGRGRRRAAVDRPGDHHHTDCGHGRGGHAHRRRDGR